MIDAIKLITERVDGIQGQIDSCVSSIKDIAPLAYNGERGMKELLSELGQSLILYQAQRRVLQELLEELCPENEQFEAEMMRHGESAGVG